MNIITSENTFVTSVDYLLKKFDKSIVYKIKYFINTIFEIIIKSEKICNIDIDLIPKLLAYENSELYVKFLDVCADDHCIKIYKSYVEDEIYNEFLIISISFMHYILELTESEEFVVLNIDTKSNKIKILTKLIIENLTRMGMNPYNIDTNDLEYNGSINLNITVH